MIRIDYDLVDKLNGKVIEKNFNIISFDVVSMYTNILTDLVLKNIECRWNLIENKTSIPLHEFVKAIMIIINSTFFRFDKKIFKQIFGMPMGSPLSPILANIVLQDLEQEIFTTNNIISPFYLRYVDDIVLAVHEEKVEEVLDLFNSYHDRLRYG